MIEAGHSWHRQLKGNATHPMHSELTDARYGSNSEDSRQQEHRYTADSTQITMRTGFLNVTYIATSASANASCVIVKADNSKNTALICAQIQLQFITCC